MRLTVILLILYNQKKQNLWQLEVCAACELDSSPAKLYSAARVRMYGWINHELWTNASARERIRTSDLKKRWYISPKMMQPFKLHQINVSTFQCSFSGNVLEKMVQRILHEMDYLLLFCQISDSVDGLKLNWSFLKTTSAGWWKSGPTGPIASLMAFSIIKDGLFLDFR